MPHSYTSPQNMPHYSHPQPQYTCPTPNPSIPYSHPLPQYMHPIQHITYFPSPSIPHPNTCPIFPIQHMFYFPTPVSPTTTHTLVPFVLHLHAIHSTTCPIPRAPNPIYMPYSSILLSPSSIPHSNQHISHSPNPTHALFHHPL